MNLEARLEAALGARVLSRSAVGGGCIAEATRVSLDNGRDVFVKTGGQGHLGHVLQPGLIKIRGDFQKHFDGMIQRIPRGQHAG